MATHQKHRHTGEGHEPQSKCIAVVDKGDFVSAGFL